MRVRSIIAMMIIVAASLGVYGSADAALSDCGTNRMCLWGNNDFKWKIGDRAHGSYTITGLSGDANDEMDSWANRSATYTGCQYQHANGGGDRQTMSRNSNDNNVAPWNSDEVSSWRTAGGC